jgi:hypothetical protein
MSSSAPLPLNVRCVLPPCRQAAPGRQEGAGGRWQAAGAAGRQQAGSRQTGSRKAAGTVRVGWLV